MLTGHCHCGSIRYEIRGEPIYSALCHCSDCRRSAGAPVVGWAAYPETSLKVVQGTAEDLSVPRRTAAGISAPTAAQDFSISMP